MNKQLVFLVILIVLTSVKGFSQKTCTSDPTTISSDIDFGAITWTASGGATAAECNDMADGLITFTGNVVADLANNITITITNNVNITGNFPISGGPGAKLSVNGGFTLHVTGDLGDAANNGVQYEVVTASDAIVVDGTVYGKNNNAFTGSGSISGGTLDVKNGSTCGTPCPVSGGFPTCTSGDSFCADYNVTLPIILLNFSAESTDQSVNLKWTTVMEENFEKFVIQRSQNGLAFHNIGEIAGQGRNIYNITTDYSFEDKSPLLGYNYYRLKAVDWDGYYETFEVLAVKLTGGKHLSVYPNPSSGSSFSVETNFNPSENDQIVITNNLGIELYRVQPKQVNNEFTFQNILSPGMYFVKYISPGFTETSKMIVKQ